MTLLAASLLLISPPVLAEVPYWRVTVDRVTVVANGNARRCNRLATQFLAFEQTLRNLADLDSDYELPPVAIYALAGGDAQRFFYTKEDKRKEQEQQMTLYSKYLPGTDFNIAAIVAEGDIEEPWQSVLLLYAQSVLAYGPTRRYPMWYQLGVSNLLNGLVIDYDGSMLLNRNQPFEPLDEREGNKRIKYDLASLLQMTGSEFSNGGDIREFVLRAREWAQFGLLTTPERRTQFRQLAKLMRVGTPADEAVNESFGMSLADLSAQFENRRWRKEAKFRLPAPADTPSVTTATRVDTAEVNTVFEVLGERVNQLRLQPR